MATYKVIQDIEAEDKLIWVFSFRQFVYALIAVLFLYISFLFLVKGIWFLAIFTIPIVLFCGALAYPFGKDQPTEVWLLAKVRFILKPKKRIWAQSGVKELVTITVPKKVEEVLTDGLSQTEVKSRLQALANTIDTRGWSIKNVSVPNMPGLTDSSSSDRLISPLVLNDDETKPEEDILDAANSPISQKMEQLIDASDAEHRQELLAKLKNVSSTPKSSETLSPNLKKIEDGLLKSELQKQLSLNNMHSIGKLKQSIPQTPTPIPTPLNHTPAEPKATIKSNPDIINWSKRNDVNINVLAHQINHSGKGDEEEVSISLH
jgi:hypothetical protein